MRVYLIRHGTTKGNREHRYVGCTDEALLPEAQELYALKKRLEESGCEKRRIFVSPLLRCRQSAQILFPGEEQIVVDDLRECDFGDFEYKNYAELNENADYQKYLDSMGEEPFPGGESKKIFSERCQRAFNRELRQLLENREEMDAVFVVHGGTIMAILDRFAEPHRAYFDWQTGNGEGFQASVEEERKSGRIRLKEIRKV